MRCLQAADVAAARRQKFSVFILAYTTTVREGIESVLFLTSVSASTGAGSIPIPGIIGVLLGILTGMALFYRRARRTLCLCNEDGVPCTPDAHPLLSLVLSSIVEARASRVMVPDAAQMCFRRRCSGLAPIDPCETIRKPSGHGE